MRETRPEELLGRNVQRLLIALKGKKMPLNETEPIPSVSDGVPCRVRCDQAQPTAIETAA